MGREVPRGQRNPSLKLHRRPLCDDDRVDHPSGNGVRQIQIFEDVWVEAIVVCGGCVLCMCGCDLNVCAFVIGSCHLILGMHVLFSMIITTPNVTQKLKPDDE